MWRVGPTVNLKKNRRKSNACSVNQLDGIYSWSSRVRFEIQDFLYLSWKLNLIVDISWPNCTKLLNHLVSTTSWRLAPSDPRICGARTAWLHQCMHCRYAQFIDIWYALCHVILGVYEYEWYVLWLLGIGKYWLRATCTLSSWAYLWLKEK